MWFPKSFGILIAWSCVMMWETEFGVVNAQKLEIDVGKASHSFADVLLVIDTSISTRDHLRTMVDSLKTLVARFKIGENNLRFAVIQCHDRVSASDEEKLILLHFKDGDSKETVDAALDSLTSLNGNPFIVCFRAALHHVFTEKNGDRPDAPNVVMFLSDAQWEIDNNDTPIMGNPGAIIDVMKKNNVTFIAATFCGRRENWTPTEFNNYCELSKLRNREVASKPQYSVPMFEFNANNEGIQSALQQSTSCKQNAELLSCEWDGTQRCRREIKLAEKFSNSVCEQFAEKEHLLKPESIAKDTGCSDVQQLDANSKGCVFDKEKVCRAQTFSIGKRAGNLFDTYRSGKPIEDDYNMCFKNQPEGEICNELVCLINGCSNDKKLCGNQAYLENCPQAVDKVCSGTDKIDKRCLLLYYNRKNDKYIAKVITHWDKNKPITQIMYESMKQLCEDGELKIQCSKWLLDTFKSNIDKICNSTASVTDVDCTKNFDPSICTRSTMATTTVGIGSTMATTTVDIGSTMATTTVGVGFTNSHIRDVPNSKKATGGFATGLVMGILFLFLVLLALLVFLIVVWIRKRRSRKEKINVAIQPRPPKFKSISLEADITHGSQSMTQKTGSTVTRTPKASKKAGLAKKQKTRKIETAKLSKKNTGRKSTVKGRHN